MCSHSSRRHVIPRAGKNCEVSLHRVGSKMHGISCVYSKIPCQLLISSLIPMSTINIKINLISLKERRSTARSIPSHFRPVDLRERGPMNQRIRFRVRRLIQFCRAILSLRRHVNLSSRLRGLSHGLLALPISSSLKEGPSDTTQCQNAQWNADADPNCCGVIVRGGFSVSFLSARSIGGSCWGRVGPSGGNIKRSPTEYHLSILQDKGRISIGASSSVIIFALIAAAVSCAAVVIQSHADNRGVGAGLVIYCAVSVGQICESS
jgi:hypothetical protein